MSTVIKVESRSKITEIKMRGKTVTAEKSSLHFEKFFDTMTMLLQHTERWPSG